MPITYEVCEKVKNINLQCREQCRCARGHTVQFERVESDRAGVGNEVGKQDSSEKTAEIDSEEVGFDG